MRAVHAGTVTVVARAVAAGHLRAVDMVARALDRIERSDGALGAVVAMRADGALRDAAFIDATIAAGGDVGPLAGVPILVKDLEDVAGMRTTQGSLLLADAPPATADGLIPARLRAAGAIVVGKSNLPEFATEGYTDNLLFGPTRNPWDRDWSPGGSSGGSAAALSAGLVPAATATDGGGSIRIPAAMCGLVGIKPTHGLIARFPVHDWIDLSTCGPLATTTDDLRLLLAIESGPAAGDPTAIPGDFRQADVAPPTRLYAAQRTSDLGPLPDGVSKSLEAAVGAMADVLRLDVTWLEPGRIFLDGDPDFDWFTLATAEHVASLGRTWVEDRLDRMHPAAQAFMRTGLEIGIDAYLAARRRRFDHVRRLDLLLGASDLLLTPTVALEGWTPDGRIAASSDGSAMLRPAAYSTAVQNVTGHPAMSVPAGRSANGLPFGLQITGPRFADSLLIDVAARWETAFPWPLVAPGYDPFDAGLMD